MGLKRKQAGENLIWNPDAGKRISIFLLYEYKKVFHIRQYK
jgi:hypothetical protein